MCVGGHRVPIVHLTIEPAQGRPKRLGLSPRPLPDIAIAHGEEQHERNGCQMPIESKPMDAAAQ